MAIGEVFLGAFLQVLFDRLASGSLLDFVGQFARLPSMLEKLRKKFPYIQAVLIDAEEKQINDRFVKKWMDDVQDLAYDLEDLLDELATKALKRQMMARNDRNKVWNLVPDSFTSLKFKRDMVSNIEKIISRLEELCKLKNDLGLKEISGGTSSSSSSTSTWQRPPTTSLSSASAILGRDEDKTRILEKVLQEDSSEDTCTSIQVISIVGMGGLGKTTLVQAVYNDPRIAQNFDVKAWVCVSQDFDVLRISKAILKDITFSSSCDSLDFNQVQRQLRDLVTGKKFLIVLDDVWSDNYSHWKVLKSPFKNAAQGSKIILTTRTVNVANTFGSLEHHQLEFLSGDDCWSIFKQLVLEDRQDDSYGNLEDLREKVVGKCKGLPLAVQSLGGLLRSKEISEWEDILSNKIWEELESKKSDNVLPVLRISYQLLPLHLKRCFAYSAIFPEDYIFDAQELVLLWMAAGFVPESKDIKQMEDLGREYFRDLLSRSFFQPLNVDCSEYTMHDLIHELACSVSGETSFRLEDVVGPNQQQKVNERARHFSYKSEYCVGKDKFEILSQAPHLRTFLPLRDHKYLPLHFISNAVVADVLPKLKKLRVMSLKYCQNVVLPESIKSLRHLRYLNLAGTKIRSLPESTSSLINLQTLDLRNCSELEKLPSKMKDLVNLRYLNIKGACLISEMPVGMKEIKYLRFLSNFIVGKGRSSGLEDLKHLKFLSGELCVSGLENVNDIREHILSETKDLEVLRLEWKSDFDDHSREENIEKMVLDRLQPHSNMEELQIKGYYGQDFPSWVGDSKFSSMKILNLENCGKCTSLPSIAQLDSLKELTIKGIRGVISVSSNFYNTSLETLCFENLQEWEHWESNPKNQHGQKFLHIRKLSIVDCPKLLGYLPQHLPSLQELEIKRCTKLEVFLSNLPMICNLDIDGCRKLVCSSPFNSRELKSMTLSSVSEFESCSIRMLQNVSRLKIVNCKNFLHLWGNGLSLGKQLHEVHGLTSLTELCIEEFQNLALLPENFILPNLKRLEFKRLDALTALPEGIVLNSPHLEVLTIDECDSLKFIAKVQFPSLKELSVGNCKSLECLLDDGEDVCVVSSFPSASAMIHKESINNSITPLLENLTIARCSSLMSLSSKEALPTTLKHLNIGDCEELTTLSVGGQLPAALQNLNIWYCPKLQSIGERFDNNKYLERIVIFVCKNLKSIPEGLHELNCLREITIWRCAGLDSLAERELPSNIQNVHINECEKLQTLPKGINNLNSLQILRIGKCPGITSFVEEGLPTSLTRLEIEGDMNMYKPLIEWGLDRLTSLGTLVITECEDALSFPVEEMSMTLPSSLTELYIRDCSKLKYLSSRGFENLTSLEYLETYDCPNLKYFPEQGLPSSLLRLDIFGCPILEERCKREKGKYWNKISHIPRVQIKSKSIDDI